MAPAGIPALMLGPDLAVIQSTGSPARLPLFLRPPWGFCVPAVNQPWPTERIMDFLAKETGGEETAIALIHASPWLGAEHLGAAAMARELPLTFTLVDGGPDDRHRFEKAAFVISATAGPWTVSEEKAAGLNAALLAGEIAGRSCRAVMQLPTPDGSRLILYRLGPDSDK